MNITTALIIILGFIVAYMIIIGIFSTAFRATGLTKEKARYQAVSLFTNCGFTTSESELITSNRRRRRLAVILMIVGHIFAVIIVSLVVALFGSFKVSDVKDNYKVIIIIISIFFGILILFKLPFISKPLQNGFEKMALKRVMKREKDNIITVLDNYGKQSLAEIYIYWVPEILNDKSLKDANLKRNYDLNLVTIKRGNKVLDVSAETIIQSKDKIIVFGDIEIIKDIFKKKKEIVDTEEDTTKNNIAIIDNYGKDALCEIKIIKNPEILEETSLGNSVIKSKYNVQVLMVKHETYHELANKDTIIEEGDTILVFGPYQSIKDIFRM